MNNINIHPDDELHVILDALNELSEQIVTSNRTPWGEYDDNDDDVKTSREGYLAVLGRTIEVVQRELSRSDGIRFTALPVTVTPTHHPVPFGIVCEVCWGLIKDEANDMALMDYGHVHKGCATSKPIDHPLTTTPPAGVQWSGTTLSGKTGNMLDLIRRHAPSAADEAAAYRSIMDDMQVPADDALRSASQLAHGVPSVGESRRVVKVDGVQYCDTHDDLAIEGYDWSDICHEAWARGDDEVDVNRCELRPLYVETEL